MAFPPGTVCLEDLHRSTSEIVLQPQPSKDPNDPLNWKSWRKHLNFTLVCLYVVLIFGLVNMMPITWVPMSLDYSEFTFDMLNNSYAAGCGALCIGGIVLIPFSLKYGRRPVYIISLALECGIAVWSARISNIADLMLVNIFSCFVGALCEIMVQMTIADTFFVHQRGRMNSIYVWTLTIGSSLAPLAAGYVAINPSLGWRWVWWLSAIVIGVLTIVFFFMYEETKYDCETLRGITSATADQQSKREDLESKRTDDKSATIDSSPAAAGRRPSLDPAIPVKTYGQKLALTSPSSTPLSHYLRHTYQPFIILSTIPGVFYSFTDYPGAQHTLSADIAEDDNADHIPGAARAFTSSHQHTDSSGSKQRYTISFTAPTAASPSTTTSTHSTDPNRISSADTTNTIPPHCEQATDPNPDPETTRGLTLPESTTEPFRLEGLGPLLKTFSTGLNTLLTKQLHPHRQRLTTLLSPVTTHRHYHSLTTRLHATATYLSPLYYSTHPTYMANLTAKLRDLSPPSSSSPTTDPSSSPEATARDHALKFLHPSMSAPAPRLWVPRDPGGVSRQECEHNNRLGKGVLECTDEGWAVDERGKLKVVLEGGLEGSSAEWCGDRGWRGRW